jgi:hypothetical protein
VHSRHPALFAACLFQFLFYYYFFVCVGQRSVCLGAYAGLSKWCLRKYCVLLICSPVGSASPKQFWSQCLVAWEPSLFLV